MYDAITDEQELTAFKNRSTNFKQRNKRTRELFARNHHQDTNKMR